MGKAKTAFGDPTHDGGDIDVYETTVSTDGSGNGSTTVSWSEDFDSTPTLLVSSASGEAGWSAVGTSQATVDVSGGDTSTDVTVSVMAIGDR
jgi:hypothetical protein